MWSKGLPKDVPILFSLFINGILVAAEQAGLGTELSDGGKVGGLLFAGYLVGVSESGEQLQRVINLVHSYCRKWRLKANVSKSAVMILERVLQKAVGSVHSYCRKWRLKANVSKSAVMTFGKGSAEGSWK